MKSFIRGKNLLTVFYIISVYFIGIIFSIAALFYFLIVWNMKKPKITYDFFPRVSLMVYAWQSGNVIERKIQNFLNLDYPKELREIIVYDNHSFYETRNYSLRILLCTLLKKQFVHI